MPHPHEILVVRLTSLGDVLMSLPAVKALKEGSPGTRISWLVEGSIAELLSCQGFVDHVVRFPRDLIMKSLKGGSGLETLRLLSGFFKKLRAIKYDVLIDFHGLLKSALLDYAARAEKKIGFARTFAREGSWLAYDERVDGADAHLHKVERNMLLVRHLGINGTVPRVELVAPPSAENYVNDLLTEHAIRPPIIALFPFCSKGSAFKRWDLARYAELLRRMKESIPATVLILWGPGEEEEARQLRDMAGAGVVLPADLGVAQLCAVLKRADMYVGGDTGVMHLAAFSGIPVVAIFGPTDPKVNAPYGPEHTVVRKELPCSPCRDKNCKERTCLTSIAPDEVFEEVNRMWNRIKSNLQCPNSNIETMSNVQCAESAKRADDGF
jgi:lipopolysaccharide heptosyltransferase I